MRYLIFFLAFTASATCPPEPVPEPEPVASEYPVVWGPVVLVCDKQESPESGWTSSCWHPEFGDLECTQTYGGLLCLEEK